ncbi:MAG: MBOAT family protein [Verrucomicrobiales bacterium]
MSGILPGWLGAGRGRVTQGLIWGLVPLSIGGAHFLTAELTALPRMVVICLWLLAAMKSLVYVIWVRESGRSLPLGRYVIFALAWFGMDPGSFLCRRKGLSWWEDVRVGLICLLTGALGAFLVWKLEWRQVHVMFIPMSLGFHFGALRVLNGWWRRMGFPVRTLFPNPLKVKGFGDFWSRRWNVGYSQMMQRVVGRPLSRVGGRRLGMFAVFLVSGLLHEAAITLPARAGYGGPTMFFLIQGLLVLAEERWQWRGAWRAWATALSVLATLPCLFPPDFQREALWRCLEIFGGFN